MNGGTSIRRRPATCAAVRCGAAPRRRPRRPRRRTSRCSTRTAPGASGRWLGRPCRGSTSAPAGRAAPAGGCTPPAARGPGSSSAHPGPARLARCRVPLLGQQRLVDHVQVPAAAYGSTVSRQRVASEECTAAMPYAASIGTSRRAWATPRASSGRAVSTVPCHCGALDRLGVPDARRAARCPGGAGTARRAGPRRAGRSGARAALAVSQRQVVDLVGGDERRRRVVQRACAAQYRTCLGCPSTW